VASNGTVQAKTWNPNGLAAVANLPWARLAWEESAPNCLADKFPVPRRDLPTHRDDVGAAFDCHSRELGSDGSPADAFGHTESLLRLRRRLPRMKAANMQ
jgi:hypothetical protein